MRVDARYCNVVAVNVEGGDAEAAYVAQKKGNDAATPTAIHLYICYQHSTGAVRIYQK